MKPAGIQRLILLERAMIRTPPLLTLDEPCRCLDAAQTAFTLQTVDAIVPNLTQSLIFLSHYQEEFPPFMLQFFPLEEGRIT